MGNFTDLKLVDHIETMKNENGIVALCASSTHMVLACPGIIKGQVRVELYNIKRSTIIQAHDSELAALALSQTGTRLATASDKGTLVRVFDTETGHRLQEVRRGADRAIIYNVCFDHDTEFLALSSEKGTIHVFKIGASGASMDKGSASRKGGKKKGKDENSKSSLSFMGRLLPKYFSSEWSFAQFRIPQVQTICAFGAEKGVLVAVSADGTFRRYRFLNEKGTDPVFVANFNETGDIASATPAASAAASSFSSTASAAAATTSD